MNEENKDAIEIEEEPEAAPMTEQTLLVRIAELEAQVSELQQKNEMTRLERSELKRLFPNADPDALPDEVVKLCADGIPLVAAYALFDRTRKLEQDAAKAANRKNSAFMNTGIQGGAEVFFSADEVKSMSSGQVKANFSSILRSMKHWTR